jgi:hypothetical protein
MPAMFHKKETLASAIENPIVSMIFGEYKHLTLQQMMGH